MPLIHGKSKEDFQRNLKSEMHSGKPQDQALAIAYSIKKRAAKKKMAHGGDVHDSSMGGHSSQPIASALSVDNAAPNSPSLLQKRVQQISNAFPKKAKGGIVHFEDPEHLISGNGFSDEKEEKDEMYHPESHEDEYASMDHMPHHMMASGGIVQAILGSHANDMENCYAEGGMISDENMDLHDQNEDFLSDEEQDPYTHYNQFDEFEEKPMKRGILSRIIESSRNRHL